MTSQNTNDTPKANDTPNEEYATTPEEVIVDATERWTEAAKDGFAPVYGEDESAQVNDTIFELYENGTGIGKIADEVGLSVASVKSRMLSVLLKEVYETENYEQDILEDGSLGPFVRVA